MELTNQDLVRIAVRALNEQDMDTMRSVVTNDFEWITDTAAGVERRSYRGPEFTTGFFKDAKIPWKRIEVLVNDIRDLGDRAIVLGEVRRSSRGAGFEVADPLAALMLFREGRISRVERYRTEADALEAAQRDSHSGTRS